MLEGFILGWICSAWWIVLLVPCYLVKMSFRIVD